MPCVNIGLMEHASFSVEDIASLDLAKLDEAEAGIRAAAAAATEDTPLDEIEGFGLALDAVDARRAELNLAAEKRASVMARFASAAVVSPEAEVVAEEVAAPVVTVKPSKSYTFSVAAPRVVSQDVEVASHAVTEDAAPTLVNGNPVSSFDAFAVQFGKFSNFAKTRPGKHIAASFKLDMNTSTDGASFDPQALTAAACAPAQVILGFQCPLPGTGTPVNDSFNTVMAERGEVTLQTEAFDLADYAAAFSDGSVCVDPAVKTCVEVECGAIETICLDWSSTCITVGRAMQRFAPETLARHLSYLAAASDQHQEQLALAFLTAAAGAALVAPATNGYGVADTVFHTLQRFVDGQTSTLRGNNQEWRAVAPVWLLGAIRADIAHMRNLPLGAISDGEIAAYLGATGVTNWAWSYDYQPLPAGVGAYPATVDIIVHNGVTLYSGGQLNLGEIVDSSLALSNKVSYFSEVFKAYHAPCDVKLITIPVCPSGVNEIPAAALIC